MRLPASQHQLFGKLYRQHYNSVYRAFRRKGYRYDEIPDLVQQTFLRAYRGFASFREESSFLTWILAIARTVAINRRRSQHAKIRNLPEVAIDGFEDGGEAILSAASQSDMPPTPEEKALSKERERQALENSRRLRAAMEELPPQMRQCILLFIYQGRKYREISDLLGVSINTVKSQISQAKKRLKTLLEELADNQESSR